MWNRGINAPLCVLVRSSIERRSSSMSGNVIVRPITDKVYDTCTNNLVASVVATEYGLGITRTTPALVHTSIATV
jgi:hypothetical protein